MPKFRIEMTALANVDTVFTVEAESEAAAKAKAKTMTGDVVWSYAGLATETGVLPEVVGITETK